MLTAKQKTLTRGKTLQLLYEVETGGGPATTLYLPAGASQADIAIYLEQIAVLGAAQAAIESSITASPTGAALFWGRGHRLLVSPPFPIKDRYIASGYDVAPLRAVLARDWRIGIVLVRLGHYAIGMCEGERLVEHKAGTGLVHARHRQGGSSANRFRRRREEQTYHFLMRVAEHAQGMFAPHAKTLDYLVYGGARTTILELRKHSRFLGQFDDRLLPPLLTLPDPGYGVLQDSVQMVWSSRVTEWTDEVPATTL